MNLSLSDLFEATQPAPAVVRASQRPGFSSKWSRGRVESLIQNDLKRAFDAIVVTLEPRGTSGGHPAVLAPDQFAYVLTGGLTLRLDEETVQLRKGDSVVIPSRVSPHRWENTGKVKAQVLLVQVRSPQ